MRLVVFHYHLLPGGVTGVIAESARAALPRLEEVESVTLVCGSPENVDAVRSQILSVEGLTPDSVGVEVIGELGYVSQSRSPRPDLKDRIVSLLTSRFSGTDTVWWIHNYHLGKNPYFTDAVLEIAERDQAQRIVFHIHDFPECARYENLRFLRAVISREVYPQSENVRYVLINARDKRLLEQAGIAPELTFLLQNPVPVRRGDAGGSSEERRAEVRETLSSAYRTEFPLFRPAQKLMLYPVRTIRRKNVMEAAILAKLVSEEAGLVVTLPGVSEQERKYSAMVEEAFREGLVPGLWGIGTRIDELGISFDELTDAADVIVSSSVQEGFGYQFISAVAWGHPLFARYLDILEGVLPVFTGYPHDFYSRILVPLASPSLSSMRAYLKMRYGERVSRIAHFLSPEEIAVLAADIDGLLSEEVIDFSYLAPQMQYTVLKDLSDSSFRTEITSLNTETVGSLRTILSDDASPHIGRVEAQFGYDAYAGGVRSILESFDSSPPVLHRGDGNVQSALVRSFARREYARLLYE
jgi:hypothetical protein